MGNHVLLGHGSGGKLMERLIRESIFPALDNEILGRMGDSALLPFEGATLAFTTDSYVVSPLFFPGGDIGRLAVCGTVNDLSVSGAVPLYLSLGFIIEEGFPLDEFEKINRSIGDTAQEAGVRVVTGDTKVVNRGCADGIFINTSGIGPVRPGTDTSGCNVKPGDSVIVSGPLGDHGVAVMSVREGLEMDTPVLSDVAPLNGMLEGLFELEAGVRFLRDPTRGGLASALNEFVKSTGLSVSLDEERIPVRPEVLGVCELLGLDPLYIANEGRCVAIVDRDQTDRALQILQAHPFGKDARRIGEVASEPAGKVILKTQIGGTRIVDTLIGDQLPRIC